MKVHEWLSFSRLLPTLPSISRVDEGSRKRDAEVDVVAAAGPLKNVTLNVMIQIQTTLIVMIQIKMTLYICFSILKRS